MVHSETLILQTQGFSYFVDVTGEVSRVLSESGLKEGIACVSIIGATASVTTIEYEPALLQDFRDKLEEFWSEARRSRHSQTWGDDNGFSHIRASMMGPSVALPFKDGKLLVGTWQQVVVVDHDNRKRDRQVHVQLVGE